MSSYPIDPELRELAGLLSGPLFDLGAISSVAPEDRGLTRIGGIRRDQPQLAGVDRQDVVVTGAGDDRGIRVRVYSPAPASPGEPTSSESGGLLFIHGGGFIMGSIEMNDAFCDGICAATQVVVASVDYRLAPEDPFPAGLDDCYEALEWFVGNAEDFGVDPARVAVGGMSAGGGLAAAVALRARDQGGPALCFQMLLIPELDDRLTTPSMEEYTDTPVWARPSAIWSWRHYLGPLLGGDVPYEAAPARCLDLKGLPPALVTTMQFDPLRDEGNDYAVRLINAGVEADVHCFLGAFHGSSAVADAAVSRAEAKVVVAALLRALTP